MARSTTSVGSPRIVSARARLGSAHLGERASHPSENVIVHEGSLSQPALVILCCTVKHPRSASRAVCAPSLLAAATSTVGSGNGPHGGKTHVDDDGAGITHSSAFRRAHAARHPCRAIDQSTVVPAAAVTSSSTRSSDFDSGADATSRRARAAPPPRARSRRRNRRCRRRASIGDAHRSHGELGCRLEGAAGDRHHTGARSRPRRSRPSAPPRRRQRLPHGAWSREPRPGRRPSSTRERRERTVTQRGDDAVLWPHGSPAHPDREERHHRGWWGSRCRGGLLRRRVPGLLPHRVPPSLGSRPCRARR